MNDAVLVLAILGVSAIWIIGIGYLRYRFEQAYNGDRFPVIWLWPLVVPGAILYVPLRALFRLGAWLARRRLRLMRNDSLPKARVLP